MAKKKKTTKSKTTKILRTIACKYLKNIDDISNAKKPLCYCTERKFNLSPYNLICQICTLYVENSSQTEMSEMYHASEAKDFKFDENDLEFSDEDFIVEEEEGKKKKKSKKSKKKSKKKKVEDDDDDDFEIEKVTEEEEEVVIIGHEKEEKEDNDYVDEKEEGLGKKHGSIKGEEEEDEEDEDFEDEIEDFDGNDKEGNGDESSIDFEKEVIGKIKKIGSGDSIKEICPYCQKAKVSVLRHISKCKKCPPEVISAYKSWKTKKK